MEYLAYLVDGLNQQDLALLVNRLAVGTFFGISGYHKLFDSDRHALLVSTLEKCGVPWIPFNQWFVPLVEFFGGIALVVGFLAPLAALGMLVILLVAIMTDGLQRIADYKPINKADFLCDCLYLPEVVYSIMLLVVILAGPGTYRFSTLII